MGQLPFIIIMFLSVVFSSPVPGMAEETRPVVVEQTIDAQLESLDLVDVKSFIQQVDREVGQYLPEISLEKILEDMKNGHLQLSFREVLSGLARYFFSEIIAHSALLGKLVILAVVCAVLQNLQAAFEKGTTSKLAYAVTYLVLITIALGSFTLAINTGRQAIDQMITFIHALLPALLTLMAAMGGLTSATLLHPFVMVALSLLGTLINNLVFPLIYFGAVLAIISHISEKFKVSRLAGLLKEVSLGLLGLFLTTFVGLLSLQGVAGAVVDSVGLRTAKFVTGSFVPVIGGMLSDALEAVVGTSILLKNAIGLVGVLVIFALAAFPVIKILSLVIIYRLAAALVQPFGDTQIADSLQTMGSSLIIVFGAVAAVGLMFFIALSIIVGLGNITVMLR